MGPELTLLWLQASSMLWTPKAEGGRQAEETKLNREALGWRRGPSQGQWAGSIKPPRQGDAFDTSGLAESRIPRNGCGCS